MYSRLLAAMALVLLLTPGAGVHGQEPAPGAGDDRKVKFTLEPVGKSTSVINLERNGTTLTYADKVIVSTEAGTLELLSTPTTKLEPRKQDSRRPIYVSENIPPGGATILPKLMRVVKGAPPTVVARGEATYLYKGVEEHKPVELPPMNFEIAIKLTPLEAANTYLEYSVALPEQIFTYTYASRVNLDGGQRTTAERTSVNPAAGTLFGDQLPHSPPAAKP